MKTKTLTISLPESLRLYVEERAEYNYGSVSEYIRELIRSEQRRAFEAMDPANNRHRNAAGTPQRSQPERFPFRGD